MEQQTKVEQEFLELLRELDEDTKGEIVKYIKVSGYNSLGSTKSQIQQITAKLENVFQYDEGYTKEIDRGARTIWIKLNSAE